jgi:hypothetical protein
VAGQQGKAEREVWAGEDGEGLDEDVGDGLVAGEMRVELVAEYNALAQARSGITDRVVVVCDIQIELIINFKGWGDSVPIPQVIGNVVYVHHESWIWKWQAHVQLQEGQVGVAVVGLRLALLHDIVLEDTRRLGVVPVEAIEDLLDVLRPLGRKVEGGSHGGCVMGDDVVEDACLSNSAHSAAARATSATCPAPIASGARPRGSIFSKHAVCNYIHELMCTRRIDS